MSNPNNGGPAFPLPAEQCIYTESQGIVGTEGCGRHAEHGMSLRDYFAAKAMQGICAHADTWGLATSPKIAHAAYELADAMLFARSL